MDMLAAMRVFQKVASTLSFTEAGDLLGLAPSSVSRQVDGLEEALGVKLLNRTTRRLVLTEAGESYKPQVDGILAELDAMHEGVAAFGDEPRGRLKVSTPRVFGKRLITPLIPEFLAVHPKVAIELSMTDDYVDLAETDTDLVIRIGALGDSSLVSRPLGRYRRILVSAPSYLRARPAPSTPIELAEHNCMRYRRAGERVIWNFVGPDGEGGLVHVPQGNFVANDVEALLLATESGLGIAMLPYWLVRDRLESGALVQVLTDYPFASNAQESGIHFVYAINRRQSRKVHAFMDHVSARVSKLLT